MRVLVLHTLPLHAAADGRVVGEFDLNAVAAGIASALPGAIVAGVRGAVPEITRPLDACRRVARFPAGEPRRQEMRI
ncbi:MAG TPA: hypothetical protein VGH38_07555 [Bryobacteraceae bacterium]